MVQELLPILPHSLSSGEAALCVALIAGGLIFWLIGAVWGRALLTLIAVALGATLGMLVPRWQLWPINSMAAAVLGAVFFGVSAFLVQRVWSGIVLGVVLVAWTTMGVWMEVRGDQPIVQREDWEVATMTPPQRARDLWERMPETVRRVLPFAAATAMVSAMAIALLWPRLAKVSAFSTLGVTLFFLATLTLTMNRRSDWLKLVPEQVSIQAAVLGVLALLGIVVQWQLLPAKVTKIPEAEQEKRKDESSTTDFSKGKFV